MLPVVEAGSNLDVFDEVVPDIDVVAAVANEAAVAAEAVVRVGVDVMVVVDACIADVVVLLPPPLVVTVIIVTNFIILKVFNKWSLNNYSQCSHNLENKNFMNL